MPSRSRADCGGSDHRRGIARRLADSRLRSEARSIPDVAPPEFRRAGRLGGPPTALSAPSPMGFVPGGQIDEKVLEDPFGADTWDGERFATLNVHVLNSAQYRAVTGREPPSSPISAHTYTIRFSVVHTLRGAGGRPPVRRARQPRVDCGIVGIRRARKNADRPIDISEDQLVDLERNGRDRPSKKGA